MLKFGAAKTWLFNEGNAIAADDNKPAFFKKSLRLLFIVYNNKETKLQNYGGLIAPQ